MSRYILTIILSVGFTPIEDNAISALISAGSVEFTQPISSLPEDITVPYPIPEELANSIVTYASILSLEAGFKKCR